MRPTLARTRTGGNDEAATNRHAESAPDIMRRTISSAQTFFLKVVLPVLWIGVFVSSTVLLLVGIPGLRGSTGNPAPTGTKWAMLIASVVGTVVIYWFCVRLKRVELDRRALYVSNYLKEVAIPLLDVGEITENRWVNTHPVTVHFRRDTGFGTSIVFMPKRRWFTFSAPHPIVAELRMAAHRARSAPDAPAV
jgi:hypothetical protein